MKFNDLTGKHFGNWTVISRAENKGHHTMWNCECSCGARKKVYATHLTSGLSPSCGCLTRNVIGTLNYSHGKSKTRLYNIWCGIKGRCCNPNVSNFYLYGGRGITVCDEWNKSYESFEKWALENGYSDDLTIDRKDSNGNYCPENCRWSTPKEQSNNTRKTIFVEYDGKTFSVKGLSEYLNLNYNKLIKGIRAKKLPVEDAIEYAKTYKPRKDDFNGL